jgi:hypothetical protein
MIRSGFLKIEESGKCDGIIANLKIMSRQFLRIFGTRNQANFIDDLELEDCIQKEYGGENSSGRALRFWITPVNKKIP